MGTKGLSLIVARSNNQGGIGYKGDLVRQAYTASARPREGGEGKEPYLRVSRNGVETAPHGVVFCTRGRNEHDGPGVR